MLIFDATFFNRFLFVFSTCLCLNLNWFELINWGLDFNCIMTYCDKLLNQLIYYCQYNPSNVFWNQLQKYDIDDLKLIVFVCSLEWSLCSDCHSFLCSFSLCFFSLLCCNMHFIFVKLPSYFLCCYLFILLCLSFKSLYFVEFQEYPSMHHFLV